MRAFALSVVLIVVACGSAPKRHHAGGEGRDETAAERAHREAKENGELDDSSAGKWGGWKYEGERDDCHYVLGRKCFTKRDDACKAAHCKTKCELDGGGPATVSCSKT